MLEVGSEGNGFDGFPEVLDGKGFEYIVLEEVMTKEIKHAIEDAVQPIVARP